MASVQQATAHGGSGLRGAPREAGWRPGWEGALCSRLRQLFSPVKQGALHATDSKTGSVQGLAEVTPK